MNTIMKYGTILIRRRDKKRFVHTKNGVIQAEDGESDTVRFFGTAVFSLQVLPAFMSVQNETQNDYVVVDTSRWLY